MQSLYFLQSYTLLLYRYLCFKDIYLYWFLTDTWPFANKLMMKGNCERDAISVGCMVFGFREFSHWLFRCEGDSLTNPMFTLAKVVFFGSFSGLFAYRTSQDTQVLNAEVVGEPKSKWLQMMSDILSPDAAPSTHPKGFFPKAFQIHGRQLATDGTLLDRFEGVMQMAYGGLWHPTLLQYVSQSMTPDGTRYTFVGWNSLLSRQVERWLIVEQSLQPTVCQYYKEPDPPGVIDPFVPIFNRFVLSDSNETNVVYDYSFRAPKGPRHLGQLITGADGTPPQELFIRSYDNQEPDAPEGIFRSFSFKFTPIPMDEKLFDFHKEFIETCVTVENFTAPQVCHDGLLVLEYGCWGI